MRCPGAVVSGLLPPSAHETAAVVAWHASVANVGTCTLCLQQLASAQIIHSCSVTGTRHVVVRAINSGLVAVGLVRLCVGQHATAAPSCTSRAVMQLPSCNMVQANSVGKRQGLTTMFGARATQHPSWPVTQHTPRHGCHQYLSLKPLRLWCRFKPEFKKRKAGLLLIQPRTTRHSPLCEQSTVPQHRRVPLGQHSPGAAGTPVGSLACPHCCCCCLQGL